MSHKTLPIPENIPNNRQNHFLIWFRQHLLPLYIPFLVLLFPFRLLISFLQKILRRDLAGILSARDVCVGVDKTVCRADWILNAYIVCEGIPDMNYVRKVFQEKVMEVRNEYREPLYIRLTYFLETWMGYLFWKQEKNFSLDKHIRKVEASYLDSHYVDGQITEEQLVQSLGRLSTVPFPKEMSPWELLFVENFKRNDEESNAATKFVIILRFHHVLADGYSITKLFLRGSKTEFSPPQLPHLSLASKAMQILVFILLFPVYGLSQYLFGRDHSAWKLSNEKLTKKRQYAVTEKFPLESLKVTSKQLGISVTALLHAGLAGAIRTFLKHRNIENLNLIKAGVTLPYPGHPMDGLVNHFTLCKFDIPVHRATLRERVKAAHKNVKRVRRSFLPLFNCWLIPIAYSGPEALTRGLCANEYSSIIVTHFVANSNIPVYVFEKYLALESVSYLPHVPGDTACTFLFMSSNGYLRVSISVDEAIISNRQNLNELKDLINQEFVNMVSALNEDNIV